MIWNDQAAPLLVFLWIPQLVLNFQSIIFLTEKLFIRPYICVCRKILILSDTILFLTRKKLVSMWSPVTFFSLLLAAKVE